MRDSEETVHAGIVRLSQTQKSRESNRSIHLGLARTIYIRYFWQGNKQIHGHIWCIYTVLANPTYILKQRSIGATSEVYLFPAKVGAKYAPGPTEPPRMPNFQQVSMV